MTDVPQHAPRLTGVETLVMDTDGRQIAFIDGALWPPNGAVVELGDPNRDAVVTEVRLRLLPTKAQILVDVVDAEQTIPRGEPRFQGG